VGDWGGRPPLTEWRRGGAGEPSTVMVSDLVWASWPDLGLRAIRCLLSREASLCCKSIPLGSGLAVRGFDGLANKCGGPRVPLAPR
jgi:hypothetical protein